MSENDNDTTIIADETQRTTNIRSPPPAESQIITPHIEEDENVRTEEEAENSSITNISILQQTDTNILTTNKSKQSTNNNDISKKNKKKNKKRKREDTETRNEMTRNNFLTDTTRLQSPTESQITIGNVEENEIESNNNQTSKKRKKNKRHCTENNASFFCSCNRIVERRPRGLIIHEQQLKDVRREMVDNNEIDIYVIILNNRYGPTKYAMQTTFFYGFLRSVRESGQSNLSDDMAITMQRIAPMEGDFTDDIEDEVKRVIFNYPTKEHFKQIQQVRQNTSKLYTIYNIQQN